MLKGAQEAPDQRCNGHGLFGTTKTCPAIRFRTSLAPNACSALWAQAMFAGVDKNKNGLVAPIKLGGATCLNVSNPTVVHILLALPALFILLKVSEFGLSTRT